MRILFLLLALAGGIVPARAQPAPDPSLLAMSQMLTEAQQREFVALRRAEAERRRADAAEAKLQAASGAPTTPGESR